MDKMQTEFPQSGIWGEEGWGGGDQLQGIKEEKCE